jgi:hypothetical protein
MEGSGHANGFKIYYKNLKRQWISSTDWAIYFLLRVRNFQRISGHAYADE